MSGRVKIEQEFWKDIRPKRLPLTLFIPQHIGAWAWALGQKGNPLLCVEGPTPIYRSEVYKECFAKGLFDRMCVVKDWSGVHERFVDWVTNPKDIWQLLFDLVTVKEFVVEEPLRSLIDQGLMFTEFYRALWEIRFLLREQEGASEKTLQTDAFTKSLVQWMAQKPLTKKNRKALDKAHISRELATSSERLDMLFFLLSLAKQNAVLNRMVIVYDGLESILNQDPNIRQAQLKDLLTLISGAERWARFGSPLGIIIGFPKEQGVLSSVRRHNAKLNTKIRAIKDHG
jgi:hypothetical protein